MLCHLKFGPFGIRVFCRNFPWLDEKVWHEGIEVHGRAESVGNEARRGRNARREPLTKSRAGGVLIDLATEKNLVGLELTGKTIWMVRSTLKFGGNLICRASITSVLSSITRQA